MPRDFKNGKIYVIICRDTGKRYFGCTTLTLQQRLIIHRTECKNFLYKNGIWGRAFPIIHHNNFDMVLLENYPCSSLGELCSREDYYIRNNDCENKNLPKNKPFQKLNFLPFFY